MSSRHATPPTPSTPPYTRVRLDTLTVSGCPEAAVVSNTPLLLKQARRESQAEFFAMHKAWCTDGKGKDDPDSRACKKWREWEAGKTEL